MSCGNSAHTCKKYSDQSRSHTPRGRSIGSSPIVWPDKPAVGAGGKTSNPVDGRWIAVQGKPGKKGECYDAQGHCFSCSVF